MFVNMQSWDYINFIHVILNSMKSFTSILVLQVFFHRILVFNKFISSNPGLHMESWDYMRVIKFIKF